MKPRIAIPVPNSKRPTYVSTSLPEYEQAVRSAGGEPVVIDVNATPSEIAQAVKACDGVLLPGSPADVDPEKYGAERHPGTAPADAFRDSTDELLLQDAYNMRKPVFGICYGLQSLNVWRTGTLDQAVPHGVNHEAGRKVAQAHPCKSIPSRSWRPFCAMRARCPRAIRSFLSIPATTRRLRWSAMDCAWWLGLLRTA